MDEINFHYNFDTLDLVRLFQEDKITKDEITHVFNNSNRIFEEGGSDLSNTVFLQIGYTPKKRLLFIAYTFVSDSIDFIGAKVADESEIDKLYCGK